MAEYIETEAVLSIVGKMPLNWEYGQAVSDIYDIIEAAPAADVVPVVRCKDCRAMYTVGHGFRWCKVWERMLLMGEDGFCSYGERKEGE